MKIILAGIFFLLFFTGFMFPEKPRKIRISCKLLAHKTEYRSGEVPELRVEIQNKSSKEIYLPGCLDGSTGKARYPYCYFSIVKPQPDTIWQVGCGVINPLYPHNFAKLKPGEVFDPHDERSEHEFFQDHVITNPMTFRNPGVYKIRFHYSTNAASDSAFINEKTANVNGDSYQQLLSLLRRMPKVDLVSNEVEIRIVE